MNKFALISGIMLAGIAGAHAQQPQPPAHQPGAAPSTTRENSQAPTKEAQGPWSVRDFMHTAVYNMAGAKIGDINDVIVDDSGKISTIIVGVGGFLGLGEKDVALSPDKLKRMVYRDGKTYFTANATKQELESAPKYTRPRA